MVKVIATCEKCGKEVTLLSYQNGNVSYTHDEECPTPVIRILTDNPKPLGVVTSISEGDPSVKV